MKILPNSAIFLFCAAILAACAPTETAMPDAQGGKPPTATSGEPKAPETVSEEAPGKSTADIPAELKTDGYAYFGLENSKEQTFVQKGGAASEAEAGQQTIYLGLVDGEHTFKTVRTGASAAIGDSELVVRKDGLYTSKVGGSKLDKLSLEVPADLKVGSSWRSNSSFKIKMDGADKVVSQNMTFKAVAIEKVKTKVGDFDAIKVVGNGTMTVGDRKGQNQSTMWFVKDVGLVRMHSNLNSDGVDQKMTMEIQSQK